MSRNVTLMMFEEFEKRYPKQAAKIESSKSYHKRNCKTCKKCFVTSYSHRLNCSKACSNLNSKIVRSNCYRASRLEMKQRENELNLDLDILQFDSIFEVSQ
jgi:hypothetical protein